MHIPSSEGGGGRLTGRTRPLLVLARTRSLGGALLVGVDMGITELNQHERKMQRVDNGHERGTCDEPRSPEGA